MGNTRRKGKKAHHADKGSSSTGASTSNAKSNGSTDSERKMEKSTTKINYSNGNESEAPTEDTGEPGNYEDKPHHLLDVHSMHKKIKVKLIDEPLWKKFNDIGNEMIVTKPGRRLFPGIMVSLRGLDPNLYYDIYFRASSADVYRYKYFYTKWENVGESEIMQNEKRQIYKHPNSPNTGHIWMKKPVSFKSVKITHYPTSKHGNILLHTMHKYVIEIVIVPHNRAGGATTTELAFPLDDTTFLAVSAYQNLDLTQLKIDHNPFAKGFRDKARAVKESRAEQQRQQEQRRQQVEQQATQYPYYMPPDYNMHAGLQSNMQLAPYGVMAPPSAPPTTPATVPAISTAAPPAPLPANHLTNGFTSMFSPTSAMGGNLAQYPLYHPIPTYPNIFSGFNIPRMAGDGTTAMPTTSYTFPRAGVDGSIIAPSTLTPPNSASPMASTPMAGIPAMPPTIGLGYHPIPALMPPPCTSASINVVDDSSEGEGETR